MIVYLNILLFLVAVIGSIFFTSRYFVDKYSVIQSLWPLLVLLVNLFLISFDKKTLKGGNILFLFFFLTLLSFYSFFTSFFLNELLYGGILLLLTGCVVEKLKVNFSLYVPYVYGGLATIGLVEALWGIGQYFHLLPIHIAYHRVVGTFDNPAGFAICLTILSPYSLFLLRSFSRYRQMVGFVFFITSGCAIILSGSRTGILALVGVLIVHFYIFYLQPKIVKWRKGWLAFVLIFSWAVLFVGLYFLKKDSADGRLLIWQVAWEMIKDAPLMGHGDGAFQSQYMLYQAEYFRLNPDSRFSQLADNVNYPFNEFLKIGVEYGGLGLLLLLLLVIGGISIYKKNRSPMKYSVFECVIAIAICACFSYPLKYSMVWVIGGFALSVICLEYRVCFRFRMPFLRWFIVGTVFCLIFSLWQYVIAEMKWKRVVDHCFRGKTEQMLPFYEKLREKLGTNSLFLYNYAAELYVAGYYDESIEVLTECVRYWNDYDMQLLFADCYFQQGEWNQAERYLITASNMCPNHFAPLYQLVHVYDKMGEKKKAFELAEKITHKEIKIPSFKVQSIINKMKEYVENSM